MKLEYPNVCACVCVCVPRVLVSQIRVDLCIGVQWSGHKRVDGEAQSHARHTKTPSRVAVGFPAQLRVPGPRSKKSRGDGTPTSPVAPHLLVVLLQTLVIFTQRGQVDEGNHILEAVDPLLAF